MSGELEKLLIRLEADTTQLRRALAQADSAVDQYAGNTDRKLSGTERRFGTMARTVRGVLGGMALGFAAKEAVDLADKYTLMSNRLAVVTKSAQELEYVQRRLSDIAKESRVDLADTTELYARYAFAMKDAGVSTNEILKFTESLSKAQTISGASASEAAGALRQLSQGLAAGVLRGEELNSILEQLPIVADLIAQKMGVTTGELKKLGEQGLITRKNVFDALIEGSEQLDAKLAKTQPTISQGFTTLSNSLLEFIGVMNQGTGIGAAFTSMLNGIAGVLDKINEKAKSGEFAAAINAGRGADNRGGRTPTSMRVGGKARIHAPGASAAVGGWSTTVTPGSFDPNAKGVDRTPAAANPWAASIIPVSAEEQLREMKQAWDELHEAQMATLDDLIGDKTATAATKMQALTDAVRAGEIGWRDYADGMKTVGEMNQRMFDDMLSAGTQALDALFTNNKTVATATALINTYQGVTKALASYPPPVSYAMAAAQAAMGFAQVRAIQSTNKSSSGGGGSFSSSAAAAGGASAAAPAQQTQTLTVRGLGVGELLDRRGLRDLLERIRDMQRDGYQLVVA